MLEGQAVPTGPELGAIPPAPFVAPRPQPSRVERIVQNVIPFRVPRSAAKLPVSADTAVGKVVAASKPVAPKTS